MYGEGQVSKPEVTVTELLMRASYSLCLLDAILDGKGDETEKSAGPGLRQAIPADQLVDQIRKQLEEIVVHIEALQPRLRKIAQAL